jgi:hypothetical protein
MIAVTTNDLGSGDTLAVVDAANFVPRRLPQAAWRGLLLFTPSPPATGRARFFDTTGKNRKFVADSHDK